MPSSLPSDSALPSILLVDDDPDLRAVLTLALRDEGLTCITATSIDDAVALLHHAGVALVLTDSFSDCPDDVIGRTAPVRRAAGAIPVVLFTAHPVSPADTQAAGCAGLMEKPGDLDQWLDQIRGFIG